MSDADAPSLTFKVSHDDAGARLQKVLARELSLSLSQVNRLLDQGKVRLAGRIAKRRDKGTKLDAGQTVEILPFDRPGEERAVAQPDMPLDILAADDAAGWVVVNKPAGVAVHPLEPGETGAVLNALIARYPQIHGVGEGGLRSGVVHRLDVDTSGVLLFAAADDAWRRLRDAFKTRRTTKIYRAIALGQPPGEGKARLHLRVAQHRPARVVVDEQPSPDARLCDLRWRAIKTFRDAALLEIELGTGFLHQIRVMLAHLGHPLAGDRHYQPAGAHDPTGATRPMLHAARLAVDEVDATCPEPTDFLICAQRLRKTPDPPSR